MQDWNNDNQRAAKLFNLLQEDDTDSQMKEKIRAWFWSGVSKDAKEAAMVEHFLQMKLCLAPDQSDLDKYEELAARLHINDTPQTFVHTKKATSFVHISMRIAAVAILLLGIAGSIYLWVRGLPHTIESHQVAKVAVVSAESAAQSILLPDGSTVKLKAQSQLTYDHDFTSDRHVYLNGEALFTVIKSKDEAGNLIPFSVTTDDITVNVHGTVFRVIDFSNTSQSIVDLYNGSVSIGANNVTTTLTYGEKYNYCNVSKKSNVALIPAEEMVDHGFMPLLRFDESTLGDLIASLTANYKVKFVLPRNIDLSKGKFSGDFQTEDLKHTLNILTKSNMMYSFVLINNKVLVNRK